MYSCLNNRKSFPWDYPQMDLPDDILRVILIVVSFLAANIFWHLSRLFKKDIFGPTYQILSWGFLAFAGGHLVQLALDTFGLPLDNLDLDLPVEIVFVSVLLYGLYNVRQKAEVL